MTTLGSDPYAVRSRRYLEQAPEELERGDILQASEKGWGAASQMLKAVAEQRGWRHRRHNNLYEAVNRIAREKGDDEYRDLFASAGELHSNFYEGDMDEVKVREHLQDVERFVDQMQHVLTER